MGAFLLRFLLYAIVIGVAYSIAQRFWVQDNLDMSAAFAGVHAIGTLILIVAPFVLAVVAAIARPLAIFMLFFLLGAMLTAPFALARVGFS